MSTGESAPSEGRGTRYSTPVPELDDHRRKGPRSPQIFAGINPLQDDQRRNAVSSPQIQPETSEEFRRRDLPSPQIPPGTNLTVPILEVQQPTPRGSALNPMELLHVDDALRNFHEPTSIARDFEQAIADESGDEQDGVPGAVHRGSARRDTKRAGRPLNIGRVDRSRDTSSSRSTSPANSIEAFAEPRRRQRANTAESQPPSFIEFQRNRAYSNATGTRRPTLSNISIPVALTNRTAEDIVDEANFAADEEPGKTYRIDFEELEEFVALCARGLIADEPIYTDDGSASGPKVFHDIRSNGSKQDIPNVALNGEAFFEKPIELQSSTATAVPSNDQSLQRTRTKVPPPNRFTFFSSDIQKPKHVSKLGELVDEDTTFRDLFDVGPDGGVWWLDVLNPTKAELEVIAKAFKIHRLTREDIETQEAREKVELFSQYYFVCFRTFNMDKSSEDFLDPLHVYIVVCGDGVLSFSYTPNPHAKNVRRRISKLGDFLSLGPDYICYAMIDDIVDSFAPIIRDAEQESEDIEDQVFIAREDDFLALLRQIGECRKRVLNMMRLLGGKADVIKGFAKRCNEQYEMTPRGDIGLYLGDIQDHVVTMMSNLGHVEKMLSRSHANYLAQLNVDSIIKGNSTNKALAKITVVATILVPLNLITGLFGMNVHVPGMGVPGYGWFGGILGAIGLVVTCSLIFARRMRVL